MERSDSVWPDDAVVVVVLFNRSSNNPTHTDTIATHHHDAIFAVFIQYSRFQRFRVFRTQLEDMSHFNTTFDIERTITTRAWITSNDITQVSDRAFFEVAIPVCARKVRIGFVCAAYKIRHVCGRPVYINAG